ncbi:MAG TPA: SDR family NAD(P)-dependent oxidoreductase [Xanthobacteraceae bacterium]
MSKVWFVTGAGSGIGAATARAALKAGDRVVATGRNLDSGSPVRFERAAWHRLLSLQIDLGAPSARDVRTIQPLDVARHLASSDERCRLSAVTRVRSVNGPPDSGQLR